MRTKSSLFCTAALGVTLALGMSAAAEAKAAKKHHHQAPAPAGATQDEVRALSDEIESLKARLDQESLAREQTEAKAQAAQAQANAAQADAQAARTQLAEQIQILPGQVKSAVVANTPKPGWWGDTKVGGTVFADLSYINQKASGSPTAAQKGFPASNGYGFDLKRTYLSVDHKFNDIYSANITTDLLYDGTTKATQLFIKKAYLQAKFSDAFVIRAGDSDLPWIPYVENIYGYRYVEQTLSDRIKYGTSADTGVNISGVLPIAPVTIGYSVSAIDGSGYKAPGFGTFNRSKSMDVEGRINATIDNFTVAVGGYDGDLGKNVNGQTFNHTASRVNALVAYVDKRFRIGGEYVYVKDFTGVTTATPLKSTGQGYSVFGSYNLTEKVALFGRYDWVNPERDVPATTSANSASRDEYFNVGLSYTPVKNVDLAAVFKHESVENGLLTTGNGAAAPGSPNVSPAGSGIIGGLNGNSGTYNEFGVFVRYAF